MTTKALAFEALKIAMFLFPPLVRFISEAIDTVGSEHPDRPLADELREILPSEGASHKALRDLEKGSEP